MTMLDVFQDFIAFCEQPPPAFAGDTHILGFHMEPPADNPYPYNGFAVLRRLTQGHFPFLLEGFGATNPVFPVLGGPPFPPPLATMVRLSVQIGRPNPIESILQFGEGASNGGFGTVGHEEDCDVSAEPQDEFEGGRLTFVNGPFNRGVLLFKTNLLRTF